MPTPTTEPVDDQPTRPSFFLVGAPRCGTTALYRWLGQHQQLCLSPVKECHYFAKDIPGFRSAKSKAEYFNLYRDAKPGQLAGDASVLYLSSACAIDEILDFQPNARLIITLRNPVAIVQSWHEQLLVTGQEDVTDLATAWRLRHPRAQGKQLPQHCMDPFIPQYEKIAMLGEQVQRVLKKVDRERILFVHYDQLKQSPAQTYRRLIDWLGVGHDGFDGFQVVNQNRRPLSGAVQRFWSRNPTFGKLRLLTRRTLGEAHYAKIRDAAVARLSKSKPRKSIPLPLHHELQECFCEDLQLLSDLLAHDFTPWLQQAA